MCLYIFLKNLNWICLKKSESRVSDQVHSRGGFANIKYQVICCLSTHPRNLALYASSLTFLVKYTDIQKQLVHACALKKTVPVHFNAFKWSRKCFPQTVLENETSTEVFVQLSRSWKSYPRSFNYNEGKLKHTVFSLITNLLQIAYYPSQK